MAIAKHEYIMDYIPDKQLYKAVMYARTLIAEHSYRAPAAIRKASYVYKVDMRDIAKYLGQRGGRRKGDNT